MSCPIKIDVSKTDPLRSLELYCGSNRKLFNQVINYVAEITEEKGVWKPSKLFNAWYKQKYNIKPDFNTGDTNQLRKDLIECYNENVPSVQDSVRNISSKSNVTLYGYTSASARDDGKKVISSIMLKLHRDSLFGLDKKEEEYKRDQIGRSRMIANNMVRKSKLSDTEKTMLINVINKSNSVEAIREHLSSHNLKSNFDVYGKNVDYFKARVKLIMRNEILNRVALNTGKSKEELNQSLHKVVVNEKNQKISVVNTPFIEEALGGNDMSLQDKNLLATYVELYEHANDYFEELIRNSKLDFLRTERKDEDDTEDDKKVANVESVENDENVITDENEVNDDTDLSIGMYDHSGLYTHAMMHVNKDIKVFLDSIPLLNSDQQVNGDYDYDIDNALGMQMTMDANQAATVIYHYCNTNNVDDFIKSIENIATSIPGMGGFMYLSKFLKENRTAAFAFYTVFGKKVISKVQLYQEEGDRTLKISNKRSNRIDALRQEFFNSLRGALPRQDYDYNKGLIDEIRTYKTNNKSLINNKKDNKYTKSIINKVAEVAKHYFPTISEYAIENYVYKNKDVNGKVDIIGNIEQLTNKIESVVKESVNSQAKYNNMLDKIREANNKNKDIDRKRAELKEIGASTKDLPEKIDIESLYSKDYMTEKQTNYAIELSDMLVDYCLIKVENNSINALGNQSSDVINSSFLTGMMQVLKDKAILGDYGNFKFQSQQYNFSNILLEHYDENGETIYGLFRKNSDGTVEPTDYATELLSVALYDGAKNYDEDKGITYANHSEGDYIAAQFAAFNQPAISKTKLNKNIEFAGYFMRTPADAPKNFVIHAPKYSGNNLFTIKNKDVVNARKKEINDALNAKSISGDVKTLGINVSPINVKRIDSNINSILHPEKPISLPTWVTKTLEEGKEYTFKFQHKPESLDDSSETKPTIYFIKGIYTNGSIENGEFAGFYNNYKSEEIKSGINIAIEKQLDKENVIEREINTNHVLFRQLRNMFKQELLDMAVALDKFFVIDKKEVRDNQGNLLHLEGGMVLRDDNKEVVWREGISHNGREIDGAYDNYHHKKGVILKNENGTEELVGNVFKSDKFTVFDENDEEVRNYGNDVIKEMFNPLYGGASNTYLHTLIDATSGKIQEVILTKEQEKAVNEMISEYIKHLISDATTRLSAFEDIIGPRNITNDKVAEFVLNYQIAYNNFNELFEGDSKFYKDPQTFLKRAKEVQGSGVPYSIANFANAFSKQTKKKGVESPLASIVWKDRDGNKFNVKQYDSFVGVTVVNTVTANQKTLQTLVNRLVKTGTDKESAERLMDGFGFKNSKNETTVNDAQSYITFKEWIRRITARGQLNKYKSLIGKIVRGEELNGTELSEFIQVQKNFYYDQNFDDKSGIFAPRQIKNAEFVLIPQLIKGTELEVVAKLMEKHGIDQLNTEETSKAGKTNTLSIFDSKTGEVHKDIIKEFEDGTLSEFSKNLDETGRGKQYYRYEYLYTQQETPQHVDAENKAGIQIMKKIIDNITSKDGDLYRYKQDFINCYVANIKESAKELFEELNIPVDSNGNPKVEYNEKGEAIIKGLKYSVFYDKLKTELFRLGYDSNMIDYITLIEQSNKNTKDTVIPNYMSMVGQKLESIAQSVFNNSITRQKLPGFHAAQITNVGFKATKDQVSYSHQLRYHTNEKGEYVDYVEVMLPASAFHFKRRKKDRTLKTKEELLKELQDEGLDYIIGYRIPTEGKQSVSKMRIVGFVDDGYGSTIVVPNEWVAQTGSDFDIDSVYGIQHSTYIDENGIIRKHKYDENYQPEFNDRDARNNKLVDSMLNILSHSKSLEEILSRSNFEDITEARDSIYEEGGKIGVVAKRRNNRSVYNVLDQADYQEDTMSGAKLKGFSVTRDNFCSICNTVHPQLSSNASIKVTYKPNVLSYEDAVKRFGEKNVDKDNNGNIIITHNNFGWSLDNKNVVGKILTSYSSQTTAHILDAVKEGSIPNVNDFTFGVYKLFPDLGIDYSTGISFMMQNGVRRIVNEYNKSKSVFITDTQKPVLKAIRQIAKDLGFAFNDYAPIADIMKAINKKYASDIRRILGVPYVSLEDSLIGDISVSADKYKKQLSSPVTGIDGIIFDLGVILQYNKFQHLATEVGKLARVCNPDKFGAKQSIFATNKVFDDIKEIISDEDLSNIKVDGGSFLEAIYPDITSGIENYLTSKNNNSKYPILHTFLKHSTAPSVIVNRMLFRTQSYDFRTYVQSLENVLFNGAKLKESQYKDFEKYLISDLYYQCDALTLPINYNKRGKVNVWVSLVPKNAEEEELRIYREEEIARIFGYRRTAEPMMTVEEKDGSKKTIPFSIKNIASPTQQEVNAFAKLTPAQKVDYIQSYFRDAGIFNNFSVNLFNVKDISGKKAGSQTIEFIEDSISKEDAYLQITDAFTNRNPLISLTAYDLIKYAFIVEGYKMSKRGISKLIPNNLLYNDFGVSGIGLVEELNKRFITMEDNLRFANDTSLIDYVRGHAKQLNIPLKYVTRVGKKDFELKIDKPTDLIRIPISEDNQALLDKYGIIYNMDEDGGYSMNKFIRLQFDKTKGETLYKIEYVFGNAILYPLDNLEANEHGLYSANSANRKYANYNYYKSIIDELRNVNGIIDDNTIKTVASNYKQTDYKRKAVALKTQKDKVVDIDFEHPTPKDEGIVSQIKHEAQDFYKHKSNQGKEMYTLTNGLSRHIFREGKIYGLPKKYLEIKDTVNNETTTEILPVSIYKVPGKILFNSIQPYLGEGTTKDIAKKHEKYIDLINYLRRLGITQVAKPFDKEKFYYPVVTPVYAIKPEDISDFSDSLEHTDEEQESSKLKPSRLTEGRNATTSDVAGDIYKSVNRVFISDSADVDTLKIRQYWKDKGITFDKNSINDHILDIVRSGAEYITKRSESIINQLKYFVEDPNGDGYLAVNSPGIIELIYKDPILRNRLLKLILEAEAIVTNNMSISELDIKAQSPDIQGYLNKIKEKLQELHNSNIISEAQNLFANQHLKAYSSNPLIQRDLINVINGFYSTNWLESWINDLQETPNPMLQIIAKEVTADLFAKEKLAQKRVRDFRQKLREFEKRGASLKHIIDENGRLIQSYDAKLIDDMTEFREKVTAAKEAYRNGDGTFKEYIEAKLAYDKWKLKHINQELKDDYYLRKIKLEEEMLYGKPLTQEQKEMGFDPNEETGHPEVFLKYKELEERRKEIFSHTVNGYLDQYYLDQLDEVNKELNNLISSSYINPLTGKEEYRENYDLSENPIKGTPEQQYVKRLYSANSQKAIIDYIKKMRELDEDYFTKETEFGFEEELARNIRIISSYEKRDANGNISVPMNLLMENPEYLIAKKWVLHNAKFVINDESRAELNKAFEVLRTAGSKIKLTKAIEAHDAKDEKGIIDAREFTEKEIKDIKQEQIRNSNYHDSNAFSDRNLIRNNSKSDVIYKRDFYVNLQTTGINNLDWFNKVDEINNLLEPYWNPNTRSIDFELIPDNKEGIKTLNKLANLYSELQNIKKKTGASKEEVIKVIKFREDNVDPNLTEDEQNAFDTAKTLVNGKSKAYQEAWNNCNYLVVDKEQNGEIVTEVVPNHYIWGSLHPKKEVENKWIDKEKTKAINLINSTYITTPTEYYYMKVDEMRKQGKETFEKWYYENHVWNPSTRVYEPLRCWTAFSYKDTSTAKGTWIPKWMNTRRTANASGKNNNYVPNVGHAMNYKTGTGYDNPKISQQNEADKELKTYVQDILYSLVHTDSGIRYLNKGYLPSQYKAPDTDAKFVGKEFLKALGWTTYHNGKERFQEDIGYATDKTINMPMLSLLDQKDLKSKKIEEPVRKENESDEEFAKRQAKYEEEVKELNANNVKAHREAINNNWEEVLSSFILQASKFNAIQDNKYMLFYGKRMLEKIETYASRYGGTSEFSKDSLNSTEENPDYRSKKEKHLIQQYDNWVRRLVYDQWKEPRNTLTKWASRLQSLTSAQYMMMNIRGGIANITLGGTQIIAEAWANEYIGHKTLAKGIALWNSSIVSQFRDLDNDEATSLASAIIKFFNVVDYDENTGKSRIVENPTMKGFNKFNRAMYSPQTIGENYMQNSVLFAMLYDHKVYIETDPINGKNTVKFKNLEEALRDKDIAALKSVLTDKQKEKLDNKIKEIKEDANKLKDYAWYKKDIAHEFALHELDNDQRTKYWEARKKLQTEAEKIHNEQPSLMSQLELGKDGFLTIKKDSLLGESGFNTTDENQTVTEALKLLADFRGRVISVNKKIHGIYNKLGQAQLEKKWYGSLVMQYHKHIYPGMMKRWRFKGMYNEERGTIEKGSYISLLQFLATPINKIREQNNLSEGETDALKGIQNVFKEIFDFCTHIGMYWNILPEHEKANIRRNFGDLIGVVSAILLVMALRAVDDDETKEGIWYNLALYEADRLASESFQFNPIGMGNEAKKLWSTPIAAQSGVEDLISTMGFISDWLFDEDFDPTYRTGRFAGQNKFLVRLKRRIPIYRGINTGLFEITESNHYYKMGQNVLNSHIVEDMMEWVEEDED